MRAYAVAIFAILSESGRSPFDLSHIDSSTARRLFYQFLGATQTVVFDTAFDVNCDENTDQFCYDYCLTHCAIPTDVSPAACRAKLPHQCTAIYGGVRVVSGHVESTDAVKDPEPGVLRWRINVTTLATAAQTMLRDHSVDFVETYLGVPPIESQQNWVNQGVQEPAIDEGTGTGFLCNSKKNVTSALELWHQAYGPEGKLAPLEDLVQTRGVQPAGLYIAKLGWRLFQGYLGHWELQLFKRFAIFPMARELLVNDVLFPTQYAATPGNLFLRLQKFDKCLNRKIPSRDLSYSFFLVWSKRVSGDVLYKRDLASLPAYDSWGFPIPRDSDSCRGATSCEACQLMNTSTNTSCSWCMTAQGQSCATVCEDTFNYPLQCSGTTARLSAGILAIAILATLLH